LRALLLHLGLLAIAVIAILAASEAWRHATFRYVRDLRRRQQSLVLRRIVVALALALMIAFSFVTELGSVATFAGFITAGLAVALQNVILSVAAYFFLIGKYGIRVGDHVSISGVTGDVMDIGLVRLHLMELRPDGLPTGRVVVFSNAVLFQPTANFFKQIPGSNFTWHQVSLTLSPDTDYRLAEKRLVDAVEQVYAEYRGSIAQQHQQISQTLSIPVRELRPSSQLHLTDSGLEMTIRFPVPLEHASTIDDRMTRALLEALDREPRLKLAGGGSPLIHPAQPA
jgi:small-conductance mechanosensitive channel